MLPKQSQNSATSTPQNREFYTAMHGPSKSGLTLVIPTAKVREGPLAVVALVEHWERSVKVCWPEADGAGRRRCRDVPVLFLDTPYRRGSGETGVEAGQVHQGLAQAQFAHGGDGDGGNDLAGHLKSCVV